MLLKYCERRKAFRADGPVSHDGEDRNGTGADAVGPDGQAERRALGTRRAPTWGQAPGSPTRGEGGCRAPASPAGLAAFSLS